MNNGALKARLNLIGILVLAAGLCGAFLVYQTVEDEPEPGVTYVVVDGTAHPVAPQYSKRYIRGLEEFGGKGAVLFDEIIRWFDGLWRGKMLAFTLGWISALVSLALFLFARWLPAGPESG